MTSELESLRSVADGVRPPPFQTLAEVARRRTRRVAAQTATSGVLAVLVVLGGLALANRGGDRSTPTPVITPTPTPAVTTTAPTPDPTPTHRSDASMTPAEVVAADDATLLTAGVSLDDPDFRVSVWQAVCHWCPRGETTPIYSALAITADGYATTVYRRPPFNTGLEHVVSVGPGLLAVIDGGNGHEWVVRDDGTITALGRDFEQVPPADARLWVVCLGDPPGVDPEPQDGAPTPFDPQPTWCAIDPAANAVHIWQGPWSGTLDDSESQVSPASQGLLWGVRSPTYGPGRPAPEVDRAAVWWEVDGSRHRHDVGPATATGPVLNGRPGLMSCWSWVKGSPTITVSSSSDRGATWDVVSLLPPFPPDGDGGFDLSWTPAGDLVARRAAHGGAGMQLWRAGADDGEAFELVLDTSSGSLFNREDPPFVVAGTRIVASGVWSDDDGRTWTAPLPWRP
jgi:hypothetical protein